MFVDGGEPQLKTCLGPDLAAPCQKRCYRLAWHFAASLRRIPQ